MDMQASLSALAALGQETRLTMFRLLVQAGPEGLAAGDIAAGVGALQNTASSHLKIMAQAGLVRSERRGRVIQYSIDMTGFRDLLAYLMEDCCRGRPELCRPVIDAVTCDC